MTEPIQDNLPITLRPITQDNWQTCIHLSLTPEQSSKLASNLYSLAEAYVEPRCQPRGIYADERMIGFVMYEFGALDEQGVGSIPRFMIDVAWQGSGYGRRALQAVIGALKAERPDAPITISLTPDNAAARRLYESLGFADTGERVHGEDVLRCP